MQGFCFSIDGGFSFSPPSRLVEREVVVDGETDCFRENDLDFVKAVIVKLFAENAKLVKVFLFLD